jgi:hypothetical protein
MSIESIPRYSKKTHWCNIIYILYDIYNYVYIYMILWRFLDHEGSIIFHSYIHINIYIYIHIHVLFEDELHLLNQQLCVSDSDCEESKSLYIVKRGHVTYVTLIATSHGVGDTPVDQHIPRVKKKHQVDCAIRIHSIIYIRIRRSRRSCLLHVSQWIS